MFDKMMEITTKIGCNLNCRFCPQKKIIDAFAKGKDGSIDIEQSKMMTLSTFKKCVDKIPPEIDIHFSGMCEPWLNPECTDMLLYAAKTGHKISVFTSLIGMSEKDYQLVKRCTPSFFVIHIPDKEGNSCFPITREYLHLLKTIVSDSLNGNFKISGFSCHGTVHPAIREFVEQVNVKVNHELNNRAGNVPREYGLPSRQVLSGSIECRWCGGRSLDKNVLLPNGSVLLCCMDYGMEFPLGNLLEQDYDDIAEGTLKKKYREMMESPNRGSILCRSCSRAIQGQNLFTE